MRNRVKELRHVPAGELRGHPQNWRTHSRAQETVLRTMLDRIGFVTAIVARDTPRGVEIIDGHLRAGVSDDEPIPVIIVDLNDEEAREALVTLDPIAAMAKADMDILLSLEIQLRDDLRDLLKSASVLPVEGDYISGAELGEALSSDETERPMHTCPRCGHEW